MSWYYYYYYYSYYYYYYYDYHHDDDYYYKNLGKSRARNNPHHCFGHSGIWQGAYIRVLQGLYERFQGFGILPPLNSK